MQNKIVRLLRMETPKIGIEGGELGISTSGDIVPRNFEGR